MTVFEVALVSRRPNSATSPTLTTLDRLVCDTISYTEELNRPGTATLSCPVRAMSSTVKAQLLDLAANPSEAWIYADSTLSWAGDIQTLSMQDQSVQLSCVGLLGYTFRMGVISDLVYTATDQFTIAKGLVDHWQSQAYGNYGIGTGSVGTSGVTRDRTYLRNELHNIGQRLSELGAVLDGFDTKVDPSTRNLVLTYPRAGTDLSASIVLDERSIDSASIATSVAPEDLVSDISATGTSTTSGGGTNSTLYSSRATPGVESTYGRCWAGVNFDGVSVQATLDGSADAFLVSRSQQLFQPGVTIIPRTGQDIGSFHTGDFLTYSYDAGLGTQLAVLRVAKVTVDVDNSGKTRMKVEFI